MIQAVETKRPRSVRAVFVDAGGVLLRPDHGRIQALCPPGQVPTEQDIDHALYVHGATGAGLGPGDDDDSFVRAFADKAGVPQAAIHTHFQELRDIVLFAPWAARHLATTRESLLRLCRSYEHVVIVSNTEYGGVADLLRNLGICQVGSGPGITVSLVIDSAEIGIHKPDPEIYHYTARAIGVPIEHCAHVGDSIRNDVTAATQAGARAFHFDPFGDCGSTQHAHVSSLWEFAERVDEL